MLYKWCLFTEESRHGESKFWTERQAMRRRRPIPGAISVLTWAVWLGKRKWEKEEGRQEKQVAGRNTRVWEGSDVGTAMVVMSYDRSYFPRWHNNGSHSASSSAIWLSSFPSGAKVFSLHSWIWVSWWLLGPIKQGASKRIPVPGRLLPGQVAIDFCLSESTTRWEA